MEKEKVLEIEFTPVFDEWAWRITYQDEKVFKRGDFREPELKITSSASPSLSTTYGKWLFLRGTNKYEDNKISICSNTEKVIIEEKVKAINEKYGKPKRWRAKEGETYFYLKDLEFIRYSYESKDSLDLHRWKSGNYFQTKEKTELVLEELRKVFERVKKGEFRDVEM